MIEQHLLDGFEVAQVQPRDARKSYRCPECGNEISPGEGHVVVWPVDQADLRRHWHRACWRVACRRGRIA